MEAIMRIMSGRLKLALSRAKLSRSELLEIRLRAGQPMILNRTDGEMFLTEDGRLTRRQSEALVVGKNELRETMEYISNYSLYAFEEEVRQGYITIAGGHRVGVCGRTVLEKNRVRSMKYISFLNIRLAHEVKGCADRLLPVLRTEGGSVFHTLLVAPPGGGKTTMLRDIVRQLSNGGMTVGVVDERAEIAACCQGVPQNDIGMRTDVLDCCPKAEGMLFLLRSMAPEVIAVDEIGGEEDLHALRYASSCGCKLLATVHGADMEEIRKKPVLSGMMEEKMFERYVVLEKRNGKCGVRGIFDAVGQRLPGGI
ncbi:MAG: stage III sporulation protein AA [Lachnospiraceae bacterium]|nr:stage III sporulation protein AA [Lachnospiraceae bacterium]